MQDYFIDLETPDVVIIKCPSCWRPAALMREIALLVIDDPPLAQQTQTLPCKCKCKAHDVYLRIKNALQSRG